ncbi:dinitrogenase iron-molybdenum cofactor biosynthesis protein [Siculibacillus lacustris]|uniref:Dinitrogenase iron-molybdenum cofactor biosynthesis protein n=1 Tax=Siculibacillus lacustris TaxID=1549641 RepID=A0A4Q9VWE2_9HYPH|nr:dinitrogenase iron-molybdenum cofactor biosynthesis protein [Siculibacillus lacustris]
MAVAVGSRDGRAVTEHFGSAEVFAIWHLGEGAPRLVETRANEAACGHAVDPAAAMDRSVELVADCRAVVVTRIGDCALTRLNKLGVLAFESDESVAATLAELADFFAEERAAAEVRA